MSPLSQNTSSSTQLWKRINAIVQICSRLLNHYTVFCFLQAILKLLIHCMNFCCEKLEPRVLLTILSVHDLGHSLLSLEWSGLSDQRTLFLTGNCRQWWKMSPYKGREVVCMPICAKKERNGPASVNQGYSTASQTAAMCTACQH